MKVIVVIQLLADGRMASETFDNSTFVYDDSGTLNIYRSTDNKLVAVFPQGHFMYLKSESSLAH